MKLKIVLRANKDGGYTAFVPLLPGCMSEGSTEAEVLENIKPEIEMYLDAVHTDLGSNSGDIIREVDV